MTKDQQRNLCNGICLIGGMIVASVFIAELIAATPGEVATSLATVIGGSFVLAGAVVAWRSVQQQIKSAENLELARQKTEIRVIEIGFTNELFVYSSGIIQAASVWNQRASTNPNDPVRTNFPIYIDPIYYRTNIGRIGLVRKDWTIGAIIGFYTNLLEMNEQSKEAMAGRPTVNATSRSVAARLRIMAANVSQAIDGLNDDRKIPIPPEVQLDQLFMPDGRTVSQSENVPQNLQEVLLRLAGISSARPV